MLGHLHLEQQVANTSPFLAPQQDGWDQIVDYVEVIKEIIMTWIIQFIAEFFQLSSVNKIAV